uniref:hypothetical protein n=1 Tax=Pseudomonas cremoris TaxID=2724178 RepID=UPI00289CB3BC
WVGQNCWPEVGQFNWPLTNAKGAFGELSIRLVNNALPDNVKTSWLAALSIEEAVSKQLLSTVF